VTNRPLKRPRLDQNRPLAARLGPGHRILYTLVYRSAWRWFGEYQRLRLLPP